MGGQHGGARHAVGEGAGLGPMAEKGPPREERPQQARRLVPVPRGRDELGWVQAWKTGRQNQRLVREGTSRHEGPTTQWYPASSPPATVTEPRRCVVGAIRVLFADRVLKTFKVTSIYSVPYPSSLQFAWPICRYAYYEEKLGACGIFPRMAGSSRTGPFVSLG